MSIYSTIKNAFSPKPQVETKAITGVDEIGRMRPINYGGSPTFTIQDLTKVNAQNNSVFYTILTSIQTTSKSIPWNVYKVNKNDDNAQKLPKHHLASLLYRPNPYQTWTQFVVQYIGHYLTDGDAFIYVIWNTSGLNTGKPQELHIMPRGTEVVAGTQWLATVQGYRIPGATTVIPAADVLHMKAFNLDGSLYGYSPVKAATLQLASVDFALKQHIKQLNMGGPKVVVFPTDVAEELTEQQENELDQKINQSQRFTWSAYPLDTAQIGLSPVDLDILNSINADTGMVADLLGYPSVLLSGTKSSTYNNVAEAQRALYNNCVIPILKDFRDGLNHWLGKTYGDDVYIDIDTSGIEVLKPNLSELITAAAAADFATINEKRRMVGLPALEGGEGFLRSAAISYVKTIDEIDTMAADAYDEGDSLSDAA
ncbi:phage portal protein [Hymenobacter sublimis]|uniref:Phage portal protein n=1 Tax=Hymenobacter sublimis TaxID=2933777 RepID=A0ABY4JFI7_9BACT|nr:phage portal protein [Hymenobacter sublimis]UPL50552.1 phage portal protein [Hymenobacter sublimis]